MILLQILLGLFAGAGTGIMLIKYPYHTLAMCLGITLIFFGLDISGNEFDGQFINTISKISQTPFFIADGASMFITGLILFSKEDE